MARRDGRRGGRRAFGVASGVAFGVVFGVVARGVGGGARGGRRGGRVVVGVVGRVGRRGVRRGVLDRFPAGTFPFVPRVTARISPEGDAHAVGGLAWCRSRGRSDCCLCLRRQTADIYVMQDRKRDSSKTLRPAERSLKRGAVLGRGRGALDDLEAGQEGNGRSLGEADLADERPPLALRAAARCRDSTWARTSGILKIIRVRRGEAMARAIRSGVSQIKRSRGERLIRAAICAWRTRRGCSTPNRGLKLMAEGTARSEPFLFGNP